MKNKILMFVFACCNACTNNDKFIPATDGMSYKIISFKQSDPVRPRETLKMHIKQVYEDSILSDTRDSIPFYQVYDSTNMTPDSYAIFGQVRIGDSVIFKVLSDSAFKNKWPAFAQKGTYLFTHLKIIDILGAKQDFRDDLKHEIDKRSARH